MDFGGFPSRSCACVAAAPKANRAGVTHLVLQADLDGQGVEVVLDAMPVREGDVHVRRINGGEMLDVAAARLTLLRVVAR